VGGLWGDCDCTAPPRSKAVGVANGLVVSGSRRVAQPCNSYQYPEFSRWARPDLGDSRKRIPGKDALDLDHLPPTAARGGAALGELFGNFAHQCPLGAATNYKGLS
jgi:hypothetical protein